MVSTFRWLRRGARATLFHTLRTVARLSGFRHAPALGKLLGELEYRIAWRRRKRCAHDMALALGRPLGDPRVGEQLRHAHHANAQAVLEILALLDRRQDDGMLQERLILEGEEHLQSAAAEGRGAILLGTHAGNGVLLALRLASSGWPVSVVYREARMTPSGFFQSGFACYAVEGILANEGLRAYGRMLEAVRRGRILFVTLDQGVRRARDGVIVRFLGKDIGIAAGPAQLARHARTPVLPVHATGHDGAWHFRIEPALPRAEGPLATDVERLARASERQILLHPELWSWHHRRWHRQPFPGAAMPAWKK
jgi:KDO2-lipid IV(A) lauroyltransferase